MSFISSELNDKIEKYGKVFRLNLAFDVVLEVQNLFKEDLTDIEKIQTAINILVINKRTLKGFTIQQKNDLLVDIFEEFINIKPKRKSKDNKKVFDFEEDAEYIYSSFFMDYGIDLIEQQGRLHWRKFIALFQGLSDNTKIKEIMSIRGRDIPEPTKYNQKERQNLIELKSYYALDNVQENYQDGLNALWGTLERMASN
ncbi:MAG: hypothetical protein K0S18_365 [Anaerocolumna sp.]|jgi:hypothetical protein|nr:hypothetical protein [Anaerocolumna sp.]